MKPTLDDRIETKCQFCGAIMELVPVPQEQAAPTAEDGRMFFGGCPECLMTVNLRERQALAGRRVDKRRSDRKKGER